MLCFPHHNLRTLVVCFASYVAFPALCVLYMLPLNKLTRGVQVYHMFSIPCLEVKLLPVIFQIDCNFKILNAGILLWGFYNESVHPARTIMFKSIQVSDIPPSGNDINIKPSIRWLLFHMHVV